MTRTGAAMVYLTIIIAWYFIRIPHSRRAGKTPVSRSARDWREYALLSISTLGLGILPCISIVTPWLRFADYAFQPILAWAGVAVGAVALYMFYATHRDLGRNWSVSLDLRESHKLVTDGVYKRMRHPMYTAFWLWALAQALLLPNFVGGLAGLVGFGTLFAFRIRREEAMMLEKFGPEYAEYCRRTSRIVPYIF